MLAEPSKLNVLRNQQNGNVPHIDDDIPSSESNHTSSIDTYATPFANSSNLRNGSVTLENGTTRGFEAYETLSSESNDLEGEL